jgi:hypothetical protein
MILPRPAITLVLVAVAAGLHLPEPARAEKQGAFEIGAEAGFRFGGRLSGRTDPQTGESLSDVYVDSGLAYGADFGYWMNRTVMLEALWIHQSTKIENRDAPEDEEPLSIDVALDDFLVGVAMHGGRAYDRIRWWGGVHIGGTRLRSDSGAETRLAFSASVGTRTPLSNRVRLRTYARSRWTYLDKTQDVICDSNDNCYEFPRSNWLQQWEIGIGFLYMLG